MRGLRKSERVCDVHKALITTVIATESFIMKKKGAEERKKVEWRLDTHSLQSFFVTFFVRFVYINMFPIMIGTCSTGNKIFS